MKLLVLFIFVSVTFNLSNSQPDDCYCRLGSNKKIVNGNPSDLVAWQVSLQAKGKHICSGIILDGETILTVHTCLSGHETRELSVVAGITRLDQKNEQNTYAVKSISFPEDDHEATSGPNNTAILKLTTKLNLNKGEIEKACLRMYDSKYSRPLKFAQLFLVTGFGFNKMIVIKPDGQLSEQPKPTNELRMADVKIDYKRTNDHTILVKSRWFRSDSVCVMDEGSPLMIQKDGKSKVVAFADDIIVTNDKKGTFRMCNGMGRFIKFSAIVDFIKKFDVSNMCLEFN